MASQKIVLGIVIVLIIVGVAAFLLMGGGGYGGLYGAPPQQAQEAPQEQKAEAVEGNIVEFEINADEYSFEPATIRVKVGDVVRVKITNVGNIFHTFTIDEFNVDVSLNPGDSTVIEFKVDKAGTFTIYCRPHKPLGMVGEIIVEEG
jgi:nitrosocyanin